jgi:surface antigen
LKTPTSRTKLIAAVAALFTIGGLLLLLRPHPIALRIKAFAKGECTWYAFERAQDDGWRIRFDKPYGRHARAWWEKVTNTAHSSAPEAGAIMVLDKWPGNPYGHVCYVERVISADHWIISHANMHIGKPSAVRDGVPVYEADVVRAPGGIRLAGNPTVLYLRGFLTTRKSELPRTAAL